MNSKTYSVVCHQIRKKKYFVDNNLINLFNSTDNYLPEVHTGFQTNEITDKKKKSLQSLINSHKTIREDSYYIKDRLYTLVNSQALIF